MSGGANLVARLDAVVWLELVVVCFTWWWRGRACRRRWRRARWPLGRWCRGAEPGCRGLCECTCAAWCLPRSDLAVATGESTPSAATATHRPSRRRRDARRIGRAGPRGSCEVAESSVRRATRLPSAQPQW